MIRLVDPPDALSPAESYALTLLVDLSRLIPVDDPTADVVRLEVTDPPGKPPELRTLVASRWLIQKDDGVVRVFRPALRTVAEIASATTEQLSTERDHHDRVPVTRNALVAVGMERHPVVSEAAVRLREAAIAAAGRRAIRLAVPWPDGKRWAAAFTHDLDVVALWPVFAALRTLELARKAELGAALRTLAAAVRAIGRDPVWSGVQDLLERERSAGILSTWFVLCGTPTPATMRAGDLTYAPDSPAARRILAALLEAGHAAGLHGSFATMDVEGAFGEQRRRLEALAGRRVHGVRQHFLRMRPGLTQRAMQQAGFTYDSSFGFPDRNGFRLGVADVTPFWDAAAGKTLELDEVPLCWMDRSLSKYRGIEAPQAWVSDALRLARRCRAVNGLWVGVWHPNLVAALGFPGAGDAFHDLVDGMTRSDPCLRTLDELVAWRRARRGARVRALAPDGRVELVVPGNVEVALEDGAM